MPLDPINPYGSYYSSLSLQQANRAYSLNNPGGNMGLPNSLASQMGMGFGNFFPTSAEFYIQQLRQQRNNQFMQDALRADPRGGATSDFIMSQVFPDARKREDFYNSIPGGRGMIRDISSNLINMPGISPFFGGDIRSIAFGSQVATSSGMFMGGSPMFGQGQFQDMMAKQVFNKTMGNFFTASGGNNLSMTSGLDMNQFGGLMAIAGGQGAFTGMDMGKLESTNGMISSKFNDASLNKMKDFMKTASKVMATMVDIFGNQSIGDLANLAQRITGLDLSRMDNANQMMTRVSNLKNMSNTMGFGMGETFSSALQSSQFGQMALGLPQSVASSMSSLLSPEAGIMSAYNRTTSQNMFIRPMSMTDYTNQRMTDVAGLARSPNGARSLLVSLMGQTGELKGNSLSQLQDMIPGLNTIGGQHNFDTQFRNLTGEGVFSKLNLYGGGLGILEKLAPENQQGALDSLLGMFKPRQEQLIRQISSRSLGSNALGGRAASLIEMFAPDSLLKLSNAIDSGGDVNGVMKGINDNIFYGQLDQPTMSKTIGDLQAIGKGRSGGATGAIEGILAATTSNPFTRTYRNTQARIFERFTQDKMATRQIDANALRKIPSGQAFTKGFLDSLDPNDRLSQMIMMMTAPYEMGANGQLGTKLVSGMSTVALDPTTRATLGLDSSAYAGLSTEERLGVFSNTLHGLEGTKLGTDILSRLGQAMGKTGNVFNWQEQTPNEGMLNFFLAQMSPGSETRATLLRGSEILQQGNFSMLFPTNGAQGLNSYTPQRFARMRLANLFAGNMGSEGYRQQMSQAAQMLIKGAPGRGRGVGWLGFNQDRMDAITSTMTSSQFLTDIENLDVLSQAGRIDTDWASQAINNLNTSINSLDTARFKELNMAGAKPEDINNRINNQQALIRQRINAIEKGMPSTPMTQTNTVYLSPVSRDELARKIGEEIRKSH